MTPGYQLRAGHPSTRRWGEMFHIGYLYYIRSGIARSMTGSQAPDRPSVYLCYSKGGIGGKLKNVEEGR